MGLPVSVREVVEALDLPNSEWRSYLNVDTGEIVTVTDEDRRLVDDEEDPRDLPDWQRELLPKVRAALESDRFLELPGSFEIHEWSIMGEFAASLANQRAREEVSDSLRGRGAFRMFRSTVKRLGIENDWHQYRDAALANIATGWLKAHGVPYR
jgi:hypothetical protein